MVLCPGIFTRDAHDACFDGDKTLREQRDRVNDDVEDIVVWIAGGVVDVDVDGARTGWKCDSCELKISAWSNDGYELKRVCGRITERQRVIARCILNRRIDETVHRQKENAAVERVHVGSCDHGRQFRRSRRSRRSRGSSMSTLAALATLALTVVRGTNGRKTLHFGHTTTVEISCEQSKKSAFRPSSEQRSAHWRLRKMGAHDNDHGREIPQRPLVQNAVASIQVEDSNHEATVFGRACRIESNDRDDAWSNEARGLFAADAR